MADPTPLRYSYNCRCIKRNVCRSKSKGKGSPWSADFCHNSVVCRRNVHLRLQALSRQWVQTQLSDMGSTPHLSHILLFTFPAMRPLGDRGTCVDNLLKVLPGSAPGWKRTGDLQVTSLTPSLYHRAFSESSGCWSRKLCLCQMGMLFHV